MSEKKLSSNLDQSRSKQSLVLNTLPVVFYTTKVSGDFQLTYLSKGVKNLTGFDVTKFGSNSKFWKSRIHPEDKEEVLASMKNIVENNNYDLEYRWQCADGKYKWFYDHGEVIYDYQGRAKEIAGSWINITDRKVTDQSIKLLLEETNSVTGLEFFRSFVKSIANILGVKFAFISKCINSEKTEVRTLAFWEENNYGKDFEYNLEGTPCKKAISGKFTCYTDKILEVFPKDEHLHSYNARGYLGLPIYNSKNSVIGHLAVFHDSAFRDLPKYFSILQIFAIRAGSELERIEYENTLRRSHQKLELAFEEIKHLKSQLETENIYLKEEIKIEHNFDEIIGSSNSLKDVIDKIKKVAGTDTTVLIRGETGTGKELIARSVHSLSKRNQKPLIKINCPAIPATLIESELFGHEKGAFTGAINKKIGKFELADSGTILLDELGDLPLESQAKLLRVLQEKEFETVGGTKTQTVDVRVIAATNRDLEEAVEEGNFRSDLYYRLNVFPIDIPPLRKRKGDIEALSNYFVKKYSGKLGKTHNPINNKVLAKLKAYSWPGNIRELENIIERATILSSGNNLEINDTLLADSDEQNEKQDNKSKLEDIERNHIISVLEQTEWRINGEKGAAKILDINPSTLRTRMSKLGIRKKTVSF
ncbi:MAG: sigma 54-interacting transcriptional regulator [Thermodesulfobacteriota bacterium]